MSFMLDVVSQEKLLLIEVTRRKDGKWQARIGRVGESRDVKDIYLGTYDTEEEAVEGYDIAAIELRGVMLSQNISNNCEGSFKQIEELPYNLDLIFCISSASIVIYCCSSLSRYISVYFY